MERLLTADQLAETLQLGLDTVRRHTMSGLYPHQRLGGTVRYVLADVLAATRQGEAEPCKVPDGWKLVPVEPTEEMRGAFHDADEEFNEGSTQECSPDYQWSAMLAAAPEAPKC